VAAGQVVSEPDAALVAALREAADAASRRGFAALSDVPLGPGELQALTETLGELMFTPGERPHPAHDYVFVVTNRGRTTSPKSVFHTDTSYVARPPSFTLLAGVEIPAAGGETVFVDQFAAVESADPALREALRGVELLHVASRVPDPEAAGQGVWHPVLRRHPAVGRTALFVSARERLVGARRDGVLLEQAEAVALIDAAHAQASRGAPLHRHAWRAGDLLVTDNRSTLHAADHSAVVGARTLHRTMVSGEAPVAAD